MSKPFRFKLYLSVAIVCLNSLMAGTQVYAQSFDREYMNWKAEQQAHDQRLKTASGAIKLSSSPKTADTGKAVLVNINQASLVELKQLSGIGDKKAQAILDYRHENGQFNTLDDLLKVKGIGPKFIEKNRASLSL